jgi:hypothetical protein
MMLAEPQATSADLSFDLAGVRVRVSAWFWAAAALLGWSVCQSYSLGDQRRLLQMLVIWVGVRCEFHDMFCTSLVEVPAVPAATVPVATPLTTV